MLQTGQLVLYGIHGVCRVSGTQQQKVDRKMVEYYVLTPVDQASACFYVPVNNQVALSKVRPLLSRDALTALLNSEEVKESCWIEEENLRKLRYREWISSGDRVALIRIFRTLTAHKKQQLLDGKKFHIVDDNFLRDALKLLSAEISLVLDIPGDKVAEYLTENI
jgi:CarD family transcriptional regulator